MFSPQMNLSTYKINVLFLSICISIGNVLFAQHKEEVNCGHVTSPETISFYQKIKPQLKQYEDTFFSSKSAKGLTVDLVNSIPVKIHIIRNSDGSGGITTAEINSAFADLNASFAGSLLEFFICDGVEYIDDSDSARFMKGEEQQFIETNYVPGLINLYFADYIENEGTETDANGDHFSPDTRNIMSYSNKNCRTLFSEQQIARMYAFYMTTKNYLSCPSLNADIAINERVTCNNSLTVTFESLSNQITHWQWDVNGDGIIDYTTKNPTHTYESGIYDVTLTVSNKSKTIRKKYTNSW